jgi:hypothetical protein
LSIEPSPRIAGGVDQAAYAELLREINLMYRLEGAAADLLHLAASRPGEIVALPAQGASDKRADAAAKPAQVANEYTDLFGILGMSGAPPREDQLRASRPGEIVALPAQGASDERADAAAKPAQVANECTNLFGILGMSGAPPREDQLRASRPGRHRGAPCTGRQR